MELGSEMENKDILVIKGKDVQNLLLGLELDIVNVVRRAYEAHGRGETFLPHSVFLPFPEESNRIIALPAYLGGDSSICGMKWVASFPGNLRLGLNRASAIMVLNSVATGRVEAVLEA